MGMFCLSNVSNAILFSFEDPSFDPLETALLTAIINVDKLIDQRLVL